MMTKAFENVWLARAALFVIGAALLFGGIRSLSGGTLHYRNYWGGEVVAPFAIALGLFLLGALAFNWRVLGNRPTKRKLKGKAARLARQAERTTFPIDDYRKW